MTDPGVKFTSHVSRPTPSTSVVQSEGGTHCTPGPSRWKLCSVDVSSTCTVYVPAGSVPSLRLFPCGSSKEISPAPSSPMKPISVPPRGVQSCGGGGGVVGIRRCTVPLPEPAYTRAQASSPNVCSELTFSPEFVSPCASGTWSWMCQSGDVQASL